MNTTCQEKDYHKEDVYGEAFDRYEKSLRTWFVAYGIGGPVLFMTQASLWKKLVADPHGKCIGILFLIGLALQVLESGFYKMCMWHLYYHEAENNNRSWLCRKLYAFSEWVERNCLIDTIFDSLTFLSFAIATGMVFPIIYD